MDKVVNTSRQFSFDGTMSSTGATSFDMRYDAKDNPSENEIKNGITDILTRVTKSMLEKGFVSADKNFLNSPDFWRNKVAAGDIFFKRSKGSIGVSVWLEGYTRNDFEDYPNKVRRVRDKIIAALPKSSGTIECPNCHQTTFSYYYNQGVDTNGSCHNCHFRCNFSTNEGRV